MDRLESMSVFVAVADAGSFSAASRKLRMPLPTVSRKVSELEAHLDAKLLIRTTRKLALTEVGERYLDACKRVLDQVAEAELGASGEYNAPMGELIVTAPVALGRLHLLPVVSEFLQAHPKVDLRLMLSDRPLSLVDEHLDLAVRVGKLPDSSLVATRVGSVRTVVCASRDYLRAHGTPRSPADLVAHDCVAFTAIGGVESWTFSGGETIRMHARLTVTSAESAVDGALAGLGLTRVFSYQVATQAKAGQLTVVLKKFEPPPLPVHLLYVRERHLTGKLRAFLDFATVRLRERLTEAAI